MVRRHRQAGVTLLEVTMSMACVALSSSAIVGAVGFAGNRMAIARERSAVASYMMARIQPWRDGENQAQSAVSENMAVTVPGVANQVTWVRTIAADATRPTVRRLTATATWTSRVGDTNQTQTLSVETFSFAEPARPVSTIRRPLNPASTFHFFNGSFSGAASPLVIDLQAYGITQGRNLTFRTIGSCQFWNPAGSNFLSSTTAWAAFSTQPTVLPGNGTRLRIPYAIDAITTDNGALSTLSDIHEDFSFTNTASSPIMVPLRARFLIIGTMPNWTTMTIASLPSGGSFEVEIVPQ